MIKVEALAIGDELLDGRVMDTNGSHLARELRARGLKLSRVTIIPDDLEVMVQALRDAAARSDVVVCSGGLGPTDDDRTRTAAAAWMGEELVFHEEMYQGIEAKFEAIGIKITPNNRQQAYFPQSADVLANDRGTAPAFACTHPEGGRAFFLPGVPREYHWLLKTYVMPEIQALLPTQEARVLVRRTMKFFGRGESSLETDLSGLSFPAEVMLSYRAHFPEIHVTVSAWESVHHPGAAQVKEVSEAIMARLARYFVAEGDEMLAARVGRLLEQRGQSVTCAESCTGGMIAGMITAVAGSSAWFSRGYVTYANEAKAALVNVSVETLEAFGAVSPEVVLEMAQGARRAAGADYAMAVSGIAGPGGGTAQKPVGTVEIALDTPEGTYRRGLRLRPIWGRDRIRQATAHHALAMLLRHLEGRSAQDPKVEGPL